ncbi:MAG: hypothetical protein HRT47_13305 [Candidatus Caenarcaniphilales bacterium]|nr:hypothetical protein [Candidatus Caenarcaniphilales bacterium]
MSIDNTNNSTNYLRELLNNDTPLRRASQEDSGLNQENLENLNLRVANLKDDISGNDRLFTGADNDIIDAGSGDDLVKANSGSDLVLAGSGHDTVFAGHGNDILYGEDGDDWLVGAEGDDFINGGNGDDYISAGSGQDFIVASAGQDLARGGNGVDSILFNGSADDFDFSLDRNDRIVITDANNAANQTTTEDIENYIFLEADGNEEIFTKQELEDFINISPEELEQEAKFRENYQEAFENTWDLNGDGSLDTTEMAHFGWDKDAWAEHVARHDADGDSKLNFEETLEYWKAYDENGDGIMNANEANKALAGQYDDPVPEEEKTGYQEDKFMARYGEDFENVWDLNGDGSLDTAEVTHFGWDANNWQKHVDQHDSSGDGKISMQELTGVLRDFDKDQDGVLNATEMQNYINGNYDA